MRKVISAFFAFVLFFTLSGCSNQAQENEGELSEQTEQLQQRIEELQDEIAELKDGQNALKEEAKAQSEKLSEYERELTRLNAKIENLSGKEIEFTAQNPIYAMGEFETKYAEFDHHEDVAVSFDGFLAYYRQNLKGKIDSDFYFLAPIESEADFHPNMWRTYTIYAEGVENYLPTNPVICERLMMYTDVLGEVPVRSEGDGHVPWSLDLKIYLIPMRETVNLASLSLEFGNNNQHDYWGNKYINLYVDGKCFGTCYYKENAYISQTWFDAYFRNNLLKG